MNRVELEEQAAIQIQDIYIYTARRWDPDQAENYVRGLTGVFDDLASGDIAPRRIAARFAIDGYVHRYRHHFIYWNRMEDGTIRVFAILHERQHQLARLREDDHTHPSST